MLWRSTSMARQASEDPRTRISRALSSHRHARRLIQALQASPNSASIYEARSLAALKAEDYMQSLNDAAKAIQLDPSMAKAYLRQG